MSFVNLHAHSHYSLLDGFGSPESIVLRAKELGHPAVALTDHGVVYGLIEFYNAAKKHEIKPILGCEMYVANRGRLDKDSKIDRRPYHLTVLAKNEEGYHNLLKLVSKAHLEGFYYKPRVDYELLEKHSSGLIALSGCMASHLSRSILAENEDEIRKVLEKHLDIFGKENYFLEMQDNPLMESQVTVNNKLKGLAKKYGLGLVATCDSHYARPEDGEVHDILLCIQTQTNVNDENRMRYTGDFSIRSAEDMKAAFADCPEAIENTVKIAEMCTVDFDFGENLIPSFETPSGESAGEYLRNLCIAGLNERFEGKKVPENYLERLNYELELVGRVGFDTYFLIVSDFVKYAKNKGIVVGPGRGSAAGSIIAWSLDITDIDPIEYGLIFERFINPERISMPDIDIDFADHRRDEVLNYVVEKYGRDNVAQIITFGTMAPKAAVRDVGRALGYPYQEVDVLAKAIPAPVLGKYNPIRDSVKDDYELKKIYEGDPRAKILLDYAMKLEGTVRHVGTHACAVVIAEKPLSNYTALQYGASGGEEIVTQFSAGPLEELGLLKMDFLGLRNLSILERAKELVFERTKKEIDIKNLPLDDTKTFELLQRGDTVGVFQLESGGMKRYLKELKPTEFEDIVAMGALYRPGPMEWIPTYIKGKHNPDNVEYLDESFKNILASTYGVAVYQEQILQLARDFAGFTLGEADILRKAVGKKIAALLAKQREKFVEGAIKQGHKEKFAKEVFEKIVEPFAGYGFNRAHAVCYGFIAYQTAYMKANYPVEFMTALMYSDAGNTDRIVLDIKESNEMGIDVLPPSVNESFAHFSITAENKIRFGLLSIKGVGEGPVKEIVEERERRGKFRSIEDFAGRLSAKILNKKTIQALAYAGALDEFGDRNQLAENYDEISKFAKLSQSKADHGQTDIFGITDEDGPESCPFNMREVPKATEMECLKWEKEYLGMYVSGHPLKGLKRYIKKKGNLIGELTAKKLDKVVKVCGLVTDLKRVMTKSGTYMAIFTLEDPTAKIGVVMFPKTYSQFGALLDEDKIIAVGGKLNYRQGQYQIACDSVKALSVTTMAENAQEEGIYDPNDRSGIAIRSLTDIIEEEQRNGKVVALDGPFSIEIPEGLKPEKMNDLKNLLLTHKGETQVELFIKSAEKRIKLPFGINLTGDLQKNIEELLV